MRLQEKATEDILKGILVTLVAIKAWLEGNLASAEIFCSTFF